MPFRKRLQDLEVQERESATFQCEVELPTTEAAWYKEETRLWASAKYGIEEAGTERRLTVRNVSADDDAVYICETAEGSRTVAELAVQGGRGSRGAGVGKGREGAGLAGEERGRAAGQGPCGGRAGGGRWARRRGEQGRGAGQGGRSARRRTRGQAPLAAPRLTSPPALSTTGNLIRKLPRKTVVRVGDTAMFCVELARPEDSVHWLRNQEEVVAGGRVAITTEGTCHTLTISKCSLEDMGEVTFTAGDCRTSTQFFVSGKGPGGPLGQTGPSPLPLSTGPRCAVPFAAGRASGAGPMGHSSSFLGPLVCLLPSFTVVTPGDCRVGVLVTPTLQTKVEGTHCSRAHMWVRQVWDIVREHSLFLWPLVSHL